MVDVTGNLLETDVISGLEYLDGDKQLYMDLLLDFTLNSDSAMDRIKAALESNDPCSAEIIVHCLQGIGGYFSDRLRHAAGELKSAIVEKKESTYQELLTELEQSLQPVLTAGRFLKVQKDACQHKQP